MKKMSAFILPILVIALSLSGASGIFAYENTLVIESMETLQGDLTEIDTDHKRVTARWLADEVFIKYQDIVLDVPDSCVITKNGRTIELDDLEQNDPATVRYDANAQPLPRATSITVTE